VRRENEKKVETNAHDPFHAEPCSADKLDVAP
jgi:hypothetical protein